MYMAFSERPSSSNALCLSWNATIPYNPVGWMQVQGQYCALNLAREKAWKDAIAGLGHPYV
jgi:hypothetical protein